jgi:phospholipase C
MRAGDNWIGRVLSTLEKSPEWSSTAVFITYDDCGCFYDHVPPGTNPDGTPQGIRVPMVIASPYAKVGFTDSHPATFASILRFAEETFGLAPLSVNDRRAYDYANSFNFAAPPTGPRVALRQLPLSEATRRFLATHPLDTHDPT